MARINGDISDLFFNTEHQFQKPQGKGDPVGEYINLREEATEFIASLDRLGVPTPTVDELIEDFRDRL